MIDRMIDSKPLHSLIREELDDQVSHHDYRYKMLEILALKYHPAIIRGNKSKQKALNSQEAGRVKLGACQAEHMLTWYLQPFPRKKYTRAVNQACPQHSYLLNRYAHISFSILVTLQSITHGNPRACSHSMKTLCSLC